MKKVLILTTILCLMLSGLGFAAEPAGEPIKIGAVFSVTGKASWLGEPERNTAKMIEAEVNAAGGINGRPIEVIVEDDAGVEANAVNAVKKLVTKDNVIAIVGPSVTGASLAVKPIAEEFGVPLISCAAAESIVNPVAKWVFKTPQKDSDCAIRIFEYMKSKGLTKVAIITSTDAFGDNGRKQLKAHAPQMGIEIAADETYGPADTDMTAQLTKIKASDAQAVINWSVVPAQVTVSKNMRQLGMTIPLYQSHGFGNVKYAQASGEAGEGIIFPAGRLLVVDTLADDNPQKAVLAKYKSDYESKFNDQVSTFGGHAYDALWLVINAIKEVGPDKAKIRDYVENTKGFVGTGGIFNFSPEDHCGLDKTAFEMIIVKDSKFVALSAVEKSAAQVIMIQED
ncbi:MAG: ABC transporter substrate-binding protein [Candidatus Abyssobacteria bacterium SURF_17]|uniref:ABC transporter substrate-binding protein n=1 Tax=Candidatus Abyssobacteria bacterium SURF_17 TaxID=2093361 RepID=A0A419F6M0_9BACT|nr:MAG: ABC transporter substrate-binding protein [Candidatus Abyssubacteria bacterium SURF_17]